MLPFIFLQRVFFLHSSTCYKSLIVSLGLWSILLQTAAFYQCSKASSVTSSALLERSASVSRPGCIDNGSHARAQYWKLEQKMASCLDPLFRIFLQTISELEPRNQLFAMVVRVRLVALTMPFHVMYFLLPGNEQHWCMFWVQKKIK